MQEIKIQSGAKFHEYERCATNAYLVFEMGKCYTAENVVFACEANAGAYEEIRKVYPLRTYHVITAGVHVSDGEQVVDLYLS